MDFIPTVLLLFYIFSYFLLLLTNFLLRMSLQTACCFAICNGFYFSGWTWFDVYFFFLKPTSGSFIILWIELVWMGCLNSTDFMLYILCSTKSCMAYFIFYAFYFWVYIRTFFFSVFDPLASGVIELEWIEVVDKY